MKKNIFWFLAGAITVFIIFISFIVFNNLKKENLPDSQQLANAYTELDRVLYIRAVSRFKNGDVKNSLEDMKTRESIRKLIHSKNEPYLKDKDEAVDCLTRLNDLNEKIKQNPNNYKLYYERANLKNKPTVSMFENDEQSFCSDFKSAVKDYSKVIELKPDLKEAYEKRADAIGMSINGISYNTSEKDKFDKLLKEKFHQMISDYEKAIELNGTSTQIGLKLAGVYFSDGQYEKALKTYDKYPQGDDFGYVHYYGKALCYYELKNYKKVIENLDLFIEYNPKLCKKITGKCLPSRNGEKTYYHLRAKANWKLHKYSEWFKDIKKGRF